MNNQDTAYKENYFVRIIKLGIISLIVLFSILTIISLFIPSSIRISKVKEINTSSAKTLVYLQDLQKWKLWHPAFMNVDPKQTEIVDSVDGKVTKQRINQTVITIHEIAQGVKGKIEGHANKAVIIGWQVIASRDSTSTILQGYMDFKLRWYPWQKFSSLLYEKIYGVQMEQALENLKKILEQG